MNKSFEESLQDAIAKKDKSEIKSEILRLMLPSKRKLDEASRIYGESLWDWVRDIDALRVMVKWLDYLKNPTNPRLKRKWKRVAVGRIVRVFKLLFFARYGEDLRKECEDFCSLVIANKEKRNSLIHDFNDEVDKMDEGCKKGYYDDVPMEQHFQNMFAVAEKYRIDSLEHSELRELILNRVMLDFVACRKQHNQPTPTDKS